MESNWHAPNTLLPGHVILRDYSVTQTCHVTLWKDWERIFTRSPRTNNLRDHVNTIAVHQDATLTTVKPDAPVSEELRKVNIITANTKPKPGELKWALQRLRAFRPAFSTHQLCYYGSSVRKSSSLRSVCYKIALMEVWNYISTLLEAFGQVHIPISRRIRTSSTVTNCETNYSQWPMQV